MPVLKTTQLPPSPAGVTTTAELDKSIVDDTEGTCSGLGFSVNQ